MFIYKFDVLEKLKEKGYNTIVLKRDYKIGDSAFNKFRRGEMVGINVLEKICGLLEMQPGSIIKYVPDPDDATDPAADCQDEKNNE